MNPRKVGDRVMDVHEMLVSGRNLIASDGWCTDRLHGPDGGHCIRGALMGPRVGFADFSSYGLRPETPEASQLRYEAERILAEILGIPDDGEAVVDWNNRNATEEMVLDVLDRAIAATAPMPHVPEIQIESVQELVNA